MAAKRMTKKERERRHRRRFWTGVLACSVVAALCILVSLSEQMDKPFLPTWDEIFTAVGLKEPPPLDSTLQVQVLDVGNADAILLRNQKQTMLIDAGEKGDAETVLAALHKQGIGKLDLVIATHPDADHIGGLAEVIEGMEIGAFIMARMPEGSTPTTQTYTAMLEALAAKGVRAEQAEPGASYSLGEAKVDILGPLADYEDTNNQSVVCKVTFGSRKFLFMGDAETQAEDALLSAGTDLSADVVKLGHHGSKSSSQKEFLQAVGPQYALISCGAGNPYGHPDEETLITLDTLRIPVYRTDLNGTITLTSDGQTISIETEKE